MRSSFISTAILALSARVFAQTGGFDVMSSPTQDQTVAAGSVLPIVWAASANYTGTTVTIQLLQGLTPGTLQLGQIIKAGISSDAGKYDWTVPTDLTYFATYGFSLISDKDTSVFQYSRPFHVTGLSGVVSTSGSGTATVTMHLSTGISYAANMASTTSTSSTSSVHNSTIASSTTSSTIVKPTSNVTLSTTLTSKTSTVASQTTGTSSSSSAAATQSKNAAVGNVAAGGMAMFGGLLIAFAL